MRLPFRHARGDWPWLRLRTGGFKMRDGCFQARPLCGGFACLPFPPYAGATAIAEGLQTKGPGMTSGTLRPRVPQFATRALTCDPHMRPPHVSHHMRPMNRPGRSGPCPSHAARPVLPQSRNIRLSIQILRIPWRTRTQPGHAAPLVPRPRQAIPGRDICRGAAFMPICLSRRCFCHHGALPPLSCGTGHGRVR